MLFFFLQTLSWCSANPAKGGMDLSGFGWQIGFGVHYARTYCERDQIHGEQSECANLLPHIAAAHNFLEEAILQQSSVTAS